MKIYKINLDFIHHSFVFVTLMVLLLCLIPLVSWAANPINASFPSYQIIYNSSSSPKIALGVNQAGNLNVSSGLTVNGNNGSLGIAYYMPKSSAINLGMDTTSSSALTWWGKPSSPNSYAWPYTPNYAWLDATSPLSPCEAWGVSAIDIYNISKSGYVGGADSNCAGSTTKNNVTSNITNITVKNFVVDTTSILSTIWINDSSGQPMLEVTHRYGPSQIRPDELFEGVVTISNISGASLKDIRYRRTMDWDPPPPGNGESYSMVTHSGVQASMALAAGNYPRVLHAGNNGWGSGDPLASDYINTSTLSDKDFIRNNLAAGSSISSDSKRGSSFIFQFGDLACGESVSFLIYYGASNSLGSASSKLGILGALSDVGAEVYAVGEASSTKKNGDAISPAYAFGFKGVSGTAIPPTIPPKTAILPAGIKTDPTYIQTYAPILLSGSHAYQATFQYKKNSQWLGDIKRYDLDSNGNILTNTPISASALLQARSLNVNQPYSSGGRSIWTVNDSSCQGVSIPAPGSVNYNNFTLSYANALGFLMFNCPSVAPTGSNDLINFVRGLDAYWEGTGTQSSVRASVLADTFHSEMVMVGVPNAAYTTDSVNLANTEAYYRGKNNYLSFITSNSTRRKQIYVGANDGMLHAFDENLNERWAFIPPSVLSHLREMVAIKGTGPGLGTTNTVFNVDGPITTKDIYSDKEGKWKTVLMGGLGYGGKSYYALDITDPDKPLHLFTVQNDATNKVVIYWDASGNKTSYSYASAPSNINFSTLGDAWSRPVLMLLPYIQGSIQQKWVAVFGGGYAGGTSAGTGAQVFILDMDSNSTSSPVSTGGQILTNIAVSSDPSTSNNIVNGVPSHLTVITSDGTTLANYYGGIGYFTDLQGQLWKLNLSKKNLTDLNSSSLGLIKAFKTEATQLNDRYAFNMLGTTVVQGTIAGTTGSVNKVYNYFGTGDITHLQRRSVSINNRIYGVQDADFPGAGIASGSQNQTVSSSSFVNVNTSTCSVQNSWYADVWAKTGSTAADDNQKIIGRAAIYNKNVYFSAYKPGLTCGTGTSTLVEFTDGCIATLMAPAVSGVATAPTIDNKGNIYVGLSNVPAVSGGVSSIVKKKSNASISASQMQYRSWREKIN